MYLKRLFNHNKWWFFLVAGFALLQLLINLRRGMVVSPFYHYGMYSEVMRPQESYGVFEITADGEVLEPSGFSPQEWDRIVQPLYYFNRHNSWNSAMYAEANRITGLQQPELYLNRLPKRDFYKWYQGYLSLILGRDITELTVEQKQYVPGK